MQWKISAAPKAYMQRLLATPGVYGVHASFGVLCAKGVYASTWDLLVDVPHEQGSFLPNHIMMPHGVREAFAVLNDPEREQYKTRYSSDKEIAERGIRKFNRHLHELGYVRREATAARATAGDMVEYVMLRENWNSTARLSAFGGKQQWTSPHDTKLYARWSAGEITKGHLLIHG